ncbi:hypothetical protein K491DRAFT_676330 [Lophiostoma macrostomum CBS 122681]|uniref:Uncharacterized protein n=1 Tax=Lophiostoma macrostomum CBS 122681 TaxID=1314788 RepID=A0A6A6TF44_9PLEO|nr:hypothetical protein K491DRAFT_676330 [Lophiostoma macrostomum CBS 122681]
MSPTELQKTLFSLWATGTTFELDPQKSVKAEFARLGLIRGWKGGDLNWNEHWFLCFGSDYGYGPHFASRAAPAVVNYFQVPSSPAPPVEAAAADANEWEFLNHDSESESSGVPISTPSTASWEEVGYPGMDISVALSALQSWIPHEVGGWQKLCLITGIEEDALPKSITKCKEALKSKLINIVNLLRHIGNPSTPFIHFTSYQMFRIYTNKKENKFPRVKAKTTRFLRELLKHL